MPIPLTMYPTPNEISQSEQTTGSGNAATETTRKKLGEYFTNLSSSLAKYPNHLIKHPYVNLIAGTVGLSSLVLGGMGTGVESRPVQISGGIVALAGVTQISLSLAVYLRGRIDAIEAKKLPPPYPDLESNILPPPYQTSSYHESSQ